MSGTFLEYMNELITERIDALGTAIINSNRPKGKGIRGLFKKKKTQRKKEVRLPDGTIVDIM